MNIPFSKCSNDYKKGRRVVWAVGHEDTVREIARIDAARYFRCPAKDVMLRYNYNIDAFEVTRKL